MSVLLAVYLFVIGACFGSFVGALAWRLHKGRDVVRERSECEHCHHTLSPLDLVPVLSWLWLRGRCRYCKKPIGFSALMLELGLGAAFVVSFFFWPYGFEGSLAVTVFVLWLMALTGLALLYVYDLRHFLLPDVVVYPLIVMCLAIGILRLSNEGASVSTIITELGLSLLPITGVYGLLYAVSGGKWIGFGDVKLGLAIGFLLGWQGALLVLVLSNAIGCLWVLPRMLSGKINRTTQVAFGPFLILATGIAFLWGHLIIGWYGSLLY